jgi:hypothetical protein
VSCEEWRGLARQASVSPWIFREKFKIGYGNKHTKYSYLKVKGI